MEIMETKNTVDQVILEWSKKPVTHRDQNSASSMFVKYEEMEWTLTVRIDGCTREDDLLGLEFSCMKLIFSLE